MIGGYVTLPKSRTIVTECMCKPLKNDWGYGTMGLSNEERYNKMAWGIDNIVEQAEKLGENDKLRLMADKLWFAFLGDCSNSAFWMCGGDLSNDHIENCTLMAAAFECQQPKRQGSATLEDLENERKGEDPYWDFYRHATRHSLDMESLLKKDYEHKVEAATLLIYLNIEMVTYALCRYNDDFKDGYKNVNILVRQMQGECFRRIRKNQAYAYVWTLHNLVNKILTWNGDDFVNKWWQKQCHHHDIKLKYGEYEKVFKLYKKYQFREMTVLERFEVTLDLLGNKYGEYKHEHDDLLKMVKEYNDALPDDAEMIDVAKLEERLTKLRADFKEEKKKQVYQRTCAFTDNYVDHDGKVYNIWHDDDKKVEEASEERSES
jgi:hypothetical protein